MEDIYLFSGFLGLSRDISLRDVSHQALSTTDTLGSPAAAKFSLWVLIIELPRDEYISTAPNLESMLELNYVAMGSECNGLAFCSAGDITPFFNIIFCAPRMVTLISH